MKEWIEKFISEKQTFYIYHAEPEITGNEILKPLPIDEYLDADFNKLCGISTLDDIEKRIAAFEMRGKKVKAGSFAFKGVENYKESKFKVGIWEILPDKDKKKYKKLLVNQAAKKAFDEALSQSKVNNPKIETKKKVYTYN